MLLCKPAFPNAIVQLSRDVGRDPLGVFFFTEDIAAELVGAAAARRQTDRDKAGVERKGSPQKGGEADGGSSWGTTHPFYVGHGPRLTKQYF